MKYLIDRFNEIFNEIFINRLAISNLGTFKNAYLLIRIILSSIKNSVYTSTVCIRYTLQYFKVQF